MLKIRCTAGISDCDGIEDKGNSYEPIWETGNESRCGEGSRSQ